MKKYLAFLLALGMMLSIAGCGGEFSGEPDPADMDLPEDMEHIGDELPPLDELPDGDEDGEEPEEPDEEEPELTEEQKIARRVVELINEERVANGLDPLEEVAVIRDCAMIRAQEAASSFSHTRPDGTRYKTVLEDTGVSMKYTGENLAGGYLSPEHVVEGWMNSEGHRANVLNEKFTKVGAGWYTNAAGRQFWSLLFVK